MKPSLLIVGLGNPGDQYEQTRHNLGWQALDVLSAEFGEGDWQEKTKFLSVVQEARLVTVPILLVKPQTFMNRSGEAVQKLVDFYKLDPTQQLLIISDDIDLPLADLRLKQKGGPGTHNGLKSIVQVLGEEFPRLRIGLGQAPAGSDLSAWVLSRLSSDESKVLDEAFQKIPEMVREFVLEDAAETDQP